jgi:hypothetical protein
MVMSDEPISFNDVPSSGGMDIDPGRYIVKVVRLEPGKDGEFGPTIRWVFNLATPDTKLVISAPSGEPYELFQFTSVKVGQKSTSRPWIEALLDRPLNDGESGSELARAVIGKKAVALIGQNERGYTAVLQMSPLSTLAKSKPAPQLVPVGAAASDEF